MMPFHNLHAQYTSQTPSLPLTWTPLPPSVMQLQYSMEPPHTRVGNFNFIFNQKYPMCVIFLAETDVTNVLQLEVLTIRIIICGRRYNSVNFGSF